MTGDAVFGQDNKIIFGNHNGKTVFMEDPSVADFGIHLSGLDGGQPAITPKYVFSDVNGTDFCVETPY